MRFLPEVFLLIALIAGSFGVWRLFGLGWMCIFDCGYLTVIAYLMARERE